MWTRRIPMLLLLGCVLLVGGPALAGQSTVIFGAQGEPVDLDPAIITDGISSRITRQIYEGLVKYKGATTEVGPALAEKWEVSKEGTVWTFHLRKGVKFHDGTPFDAAAVVWNFDRWQNTKHPQHDNIKKAGKTFEYCYKQFNVFDDKSIITKVDAVNPQTVRITLKAPLGPFLHNLGVFVFDIASPKAVEKHGLAFTKNPVGTGPYKFVEWKVGQEVILEANKDYWDKAHAPKIQRVVIRNIKDSSQRLAALKAGEVHGMEGLNPDDVKVVKNDPKLQAEGLLSGALGQLRVQVENYPDLKANQNFLALQEELTSTENKISYARQSYNDQVLFYNNKIQMFPSNIIAGMFKFLQEEFFQVEDAKEREVPKVSF